MNFHVITVFPEMIEQATRFGVVGQALKDGRLKVSAVTPRAVTTNVHQTIDDRPFGGGDGMVMIAEPMALTLENQLKEIPKGATKRIVHLSPRGTLWSDRRARDYASLDHLIVIASRYGGVDQRFLNEMVDEEISMGDYVLSGGELPALVMIDSIARQIPGVLGNEASRDAESFALGLLEEPQYTRPREWRGRDVPKALVSGNHAEIEAWKHAISLLLTADRRADLLEKTDLKAKEIEKALTLWRSLNEADQKLLGLSGEAGLRLEQAFSKRKPK